MSSKTKFHVFRLKEVIYTFLFLALAILFLILLVWMFRSDKEKDTATSGTIADTTTEVSYIPGVYRSTISLGDNAIDVVVTLDKDHINSVSFDSLSESVTVMYPLLDQVMDSISSQIITNQSTDVVYEEESKYTAGMILQAIQDALSTASE